MSRTPRQHDKLPIVIEADRSPDLALLMLATLRAIRDIGGSANIREMEERVVEMNDIPEAQQAIELPNGSQAKLKYGLAWSRSYLKVGGAIDNGTRGVWSITEVGETIDSVERCDAIRRQVQEEARTRHREEREADRNSGAVTDEAPVGDPVPPSTIDEPDHLIEGDEPTANGDWRAHLMQVLLAMSPDGFERLAQRLLRESGFIKVEVRGKTGDGGIDGLGVLRVNLVSFQVYFQCKRWKGSVPSKEIRDFRGALQGRADKGLFITTGAFTSAASEEATRDGAIAIDLIDGDRLCDLLKGLSLGVTTKEVRVEEVSVDASFFAAI